MDVQDLSAANPNITDKDVVFAGQPVCVPKACCNDRRVVCSSVDASPAASPSTGSADAGTHCLGGWGRGFGGVGMGLRGLNSQCPAAPPSTGSADAGKHCLGGLRWGLGAGLRGSLGPCPEASANTGSATAVVYCHWGFGSGIQAGRGGGFRKTTALQPSHDAGSANIGLVLPVRLK